MATKKDLWIMHLMENVDEEMPFYDDERSIFEDICNDWQRKKYLTSEQIKLLEKIYDRIF